MHNNTTEAEYNLFKKKTTETEAFSFFLVLLREKRIYTVCDLDSLFLLCTSRVMHNTWPGVMNLYAPFDR